MGNNIYHVEETYRGYDICHWIGQSYVYVEYCGDEIQFENVQDAELFIDTIVEQEEMIMDELRHEVFKALATIANNFEVSEKDMEQAIENFMIDYYIDGITE